MAVSGNWHGFLWPRTELTQKSLEVEIQGYSRALKWNAIDWISPVLFHLRFVQVNVRRLTLVIWWPCSSCRFQVLPGCFCDRTLIALCPLECHDPSTAKHDFERGGVVPGWAYPFSILSVSFCSVTKCPKKLMASKPSEFIRFFSSLFSGLTGWFSCLCCFS